MHRAHTRVRSGGVVNPNLIRFSEQFNNAVWNKATGGSVAADSVLAPNGTMTGEAYTFATSSATYAYLNQGISGNASLQPLTYSIWIKVPSGTAPISLAISDSSVTTQQSSTLTVNTSWQRLSFSVAAGQLSNTGVIGVGLLLGTPGQVYHVWGAQLNVGPLAPYQPTT